MISEKKLIQHSKFLSLILRHQPELIGIQLDQNGWVLVHELLEKANSYGVHIDHQTLNQIVTTNSKKRFAYNETFDKIRASQGHSVAIELGYRNQTPPEILYHGTGEKWVESILKTGIQKQNRQHVHLSGDLDTAKKVGQRHGKPIIFNVFEEAMYNDNFVFFISDNGVWLTDYVPIRYLEK